ncbi:MAG: galactose oxidase [Armatimonadota bacterium]|nr:galactose oxidase [Armatimonadota bacterium]
MRSALFGTLGAALASVCFFGEATMEKTTRPAWVRVAEQTAWAPRDSCGEVVFNGKMWLLGGWFTSAEPGPRDVWCSEDGARWDQVTARAEWLHGDLPTSLVHNGRMWMMGGWYGGRLPEGSASDQVWCSLDGARWECATPHAGWSPRLGAAGVVFRGQMWILGGTERYFDAQPQHLLNDVWSSPDGVHWTRVIEHAPWAPRAFHGAVVFNDEIWVYGGGNYLTEYLGYNDVWRSPDGAHWTRVTPHAPWAPRIWFSAAAWRGRLWMLGGWSNHPSRNWNDVWFSRDGEKWSELKTDTVWSPRHEQSVFVFQDHLWLVGGNAWPLVNDVWRLDLPEAW